jgi:putative membrane protein
MPALETWFKDLNPTNSFFSRSRWMLTSFRLFVAGCALLPLTLLQAQDTDQRATPAGQDRATKERASDDAPSREPRRDGIRPADGVRDGRRDAFNAARLDKFFVSCLKSDNQSEVAIAKLAIQKASHEEVKAFAQQMVKDHTDFLAKLDRFEQDAPATGDAAIRPDRSEARAEKRQADGSRRTERKADAKDDATDRTDRDDISPRADRKDDGNRRPGARLDGRADGTRGDAGNALAAWNSGLSRQMMQIRQELADQCLASHQRELNEKEGKEFDMTYMGMQIAAHMHMVDALTVFNKHASSELQQVLDEGLQTSKQHLEHAKRLIRKLDDSKAVASRDESSEKSAKSGTPDKSE